MASTTLTVRGEKIRTQSRFRYQLVVLGSGRARIEGRTDNIYSARARAAGMRSRFETVVIVDRVTGEEV